MTARALPRALRAVEMSARKQNFTFCLFSQYVSGARRARKIARAPQNCEIQIPHEKLNKNIHGHFVIFPKLKNIEADEVMQKFEKIGF